MINKIPARLKEIGMTPYQLAQITGLSQTRIYSLVKSPEIPPRTTWDTIKKLKAALKLNSIDELEEEE